MYLRLHIDGNKIVFQSRLPSAMLDINILGFVYDKFQNINYVCNYLFLRFFLINCKDRDFVKKERGRNLETIFDHKDHVYILLGNCGE